MKKKIISILIAVLFIFGLWKLIFYISNKDLIDKGNNLYGREKCECVQIRGVHTTDVIEYNCELCGEYAERGHSCCKVKLCAKCSNFTRRCKSCAKLKVIF